ncbi:MAG: hypothetical protein ACHQSE_13200 [Gemmatimonadales bacterium]
MPSPASSLRPGRSWVPVLLPVVACGILAVVAGTAAGERFLTALRIARPQAVSAAVPGAGAASRTRPLQNMIGGMIANTVNVVLDEPDQPAANVAAAAKATGFTPHLPRARTDAPTIVAIGAHTIDMTVDVAQLRTIFAEAGKTGMPLPEAAQGAKVVLHTPRAVRAQYGNCPVPAANTIQGQVQGPPPLSTDNAGCIALVESPAVSADVPPSLDMSPLMEIALELSGMSPAQAQGVPQLLDWKSTLAISFPRNLRSVETKDVHGAPAMLFVTAGRRGPTWELVWAKGPLVYALTGYGNSADALPLANSID